MNNYIIQLSEENEKLQMRVADLKTSLEQTKQMFEDFVNQTAGREQQETEQLTVRNEEQPASKQLVPKLKLGGITQTKTA